MTNGYNRAKLELLNMFQGVRPDSDFHDVGQFHEKFGLDNCTGHVPGPRDVPEDLIAFRMKFLIEELQEIAEGLGYELKCDLSARDVQKDIDHAKVFDGLIDLNYVSHGTAHLFGYPWGLGWRAVQTANMAKERAASPKQSARGSVWDVIKPPGWQSPDIKAILRRWGF